MLISRSHLRRFATRPYVRPWALAAPVLVLLVALPLLRPLRHPDEMSRDEETRLATISAIVENSTPRASLSSRLEIDQQDTTTLQHTIRDVRHLHRYSDQPPMMAVLLSAPYWLMRRMGFAIEHGILAPYLLTVLGDTLPVAAAAGLVYRMSRLFELPRHWRALLAGAVVFASGLFSYATVLNEHVPAAVLVLLSLACMIHLVSSRAPRRGGIWLMIAGLAAGLAGVIDWPAILFLPLIGLIVVALRVRVRDRIGGLLLYGLGALPPLLMHCTLMIPITGDCLPGVMHPELLAAPATRQPVETPRMDEDDSSLDHWRPALVGLWRVAVQLCGAHGVLSHFPVVLLGVAGALGVMRRHWPLTTKVNAAVAIAAAIIIISGYCYLDPTPASAGFANRWYLLFVPLLVFWSGVWLRRRHLPATWIVAAIMLVLSVTFTLIGATEPMPREGYEQYTPIGVIQHKFHRAPAIVETRTR